MKEDKQDKQETSYPEGATLRVLGHWMGRCMHRAGEIIVVGPGGMQESKQRPGYYEGRYTWWMCGEEMPGQATGLRVEPSDHGPLIDGTDESRSVCPTCGGLGCVPAKPGQGESGLRKVLKELFGLRGGK
jgi:hypothetical protein